MKKYIFMLLFLAFTIKASSASVLINGTNFPDVTFRAYISREFDINSNETLDDTEIQSAASLSVMGIKISDLTGIEHFTSLRHLNCSGNNITELDLSKCTILEGLDCSNNKLTVLNLSYCTKLKDVSLTCHNQDSATLKVIGLDVVEKVDNTDYPYKFSYRYISAAEYSGIIEDENSTIEGFDEEGNKIASISPSGILYFASRPYEIRYKYKNKNYLWTPQTSVSIFLDSQNNDSDDETEDNVPQLTKPHITTLSLPDGYINATYSPIQLLSDSTSVIWSASDLPKGLVCSQEGIISGIPEVSGYFYVTITATNVIGSDSTLLTLSIIDPNQLNLTIDILEHGRNDGLGFRDNNRGILYDAVSNTNAYLDYKGDIVTETMIASVNDKAYIKKGFTVDGNTRLILRIHSSKAGTVSFDVPNELGARLETLEGRKELTSNSTLNTTSVRSLVYPFTSTNQATAVLIAPKDYPITMKFPSDSFDVKVKFSDGTNTVEKSIALEIHATPVVLIHGLWGEGLANFGLLTGHGIHKKLNDAGFSVSYCNYDGTFGPTDIIKGKGNALWGHIDSVRRKMNYRNIACTRVDFVCHSMGGLMARQYLRSDLETGSCSYRSYMSNDVRRIITVATPHEGSPLPSYLLGEFDNLLGFNNVDPAFAEIFKFVRGAIRMFVDNQNGNANNAFIDLALNSKLINELGYPSSVPMYAIYGTIKDHLEPLKRMVEDIATKVEIGANAVIAYEDITGGGTFSKPFGLVITTMAIIVRDIASNATEIVETILNDILYNGENYDIAVPEPSSHAQDKLLANSRMFDGWDDKHNYNHMEICNQDDVGDYVVELLKGPESKFKIFGTSPTKATSTIIDKILAITAALLPQNTSELKEYFTMTITPAVLDVSEANAIATLKATIKEGIEKDIYVFIGNDKGDKIFKLGSIDGGNTFEAKLSFTSKDIGIYKISCLSLCGSQDIFSSNTAQLAVKSALDDVVSIGFPGELDCVFTNVDSSVNLGLCAMTADEKIYNISSPLMGTEWTSDDIAFVTDDGRVRGLKEGSTTLTANYQGLTASISVDVGVAYVEQAYESDEEEENPLSDNVDDNSPDIEHQNSIGKSGAGCNVSNTGWFVILLLILTNFDRVKQVYCRL